LDKAEVEFSCNAIHDLLIHPINGNFDFNHLCKFHERIFGDVYDWAGQPRTVPMEKQEAVLGYMSIEVYLNKTLRICAAHLWRPLPSFPMAISASRNIYTALLKTAS